MRPPPYWPRALRSGGAVSLLWHNNRFDKRVRAATTRSTGACSTGRWRAAPVSARADEVVARWRSEATGVTRVLHLAVVHKPDDPRIYERECRTLAEAGYEVMYMVPGATPGRDDAGVTCARRCRSAAAAPVSSARWRSPRRSAALKPDVLHVHDPELLTLFPAARAIVPKLVYDMHEYVPEAVAGKPYIPAKVRPVASQTTAIAQKSLAALGSGVVVVTDDQLAALGGTPKLRLVLPNYPRVERFEGAEPVPELAADPRLKLIYVGSLSRARGCTMMLDVMEQLRAGRGGALPRRRRSTTRRWSSRSASGWPSASPTASSCSAASRRRSCRATWRRRTWSGYRRSRTASTAIRRSRPSCSRA